MVDKSSDTLFHDMKLRMCLCIYNASHRLAANVAVEDDNISSAAFNSDLLEPGRAGV